MYDRATLALSNAFEGQPDHICHYTQEMESRLEKEVELLSEIQEALKNNEFTFLHSRSVILQHIRLWVQKHSCAG